MIVKNTTVSPYVQCEIEGKSIQLLIDTGATVSVLTKEIVEKIWRKNSKIPMLLLQGCKLAMLSGRKYVKYLGRYIADIK